MIRRLSAALLTLALLTGCSPHPGTGWVDDEVTFVADGLTLHGTYRHRAGNSTGPAALLISESGVTDRNGDNNVAGPIGNMRQLAEYLSEHDVASLRYDKIGTGATGLGPYADRPTDVGSAVYRRGQGRGTVPGRTAGNRRKPDLRLRARRGHDARDVPGRRFQRGCTENPFSGLVAAAVGSLPRPDLGSGRRGHGCRRAQWHKTPAQAEQVRNAWNAAVQQARTSGTVPANLPDGLSAILNPGNVKAVVEADAIDPLDLAARVPAAMPVLLTCSDADGQATCTDMKPLAKALAHTELQFVELSGVSHVLRDDPSDKISEYAKKAPLSPQLITALDEFVTR